MKRAGLIILLALGILAAPLATKARQMPAPPRVGLLGFPCIRPGMADPLPLYQPFRIALRERGYIEGQNIVMVTPVCADRTDLLADLAADLIRVRRVAVIVAIGTEATQAAKQATRVTPIVSVSISDPVAIGFVAGLARPGGNITGVSLMTSDLGPKRLELLSEVVRRESPVAVLWNSMDPGAAREWGEIQTAARVLGVTLKSVEVRGPDDFEGAFRAITDLRVGGFTALLDSLTFAHRAQIARFAAKNRLPSLYGLRAFVEAGGLMAYGPSLSEVPGRLATYVEKILKGTTVADLPIEQPTKFEMVINLKTVKALGLTIPQSVLLRADEIIE